MKNRHIIGTLAIAMALFGCKDDAYYGSELPGGAKTTVGFSGSEETKVVINSLEGAPTLEESTLSIPLKIYAPLKEDITVKLEQNDALLDAYYKNSRFGFSSFPKKVLNPGSITIPAGKTEASVNISLHDAEKLTSEGGYLAALSMSIESKNTKNIQVFGVQYHFVKAVQKRSDNMAELSVNQQEIELTANNPKEATVLNKKSISFTVNTSIALDRKVTLNLQKQPSLLEYFYKGETEGFLPLPEGVLDDIVIEIPAGKTKVEVTLPFAHTDKLIEAPGYLTAFKLKELSEDRKHISASIDTYFFVKIKQTTSVGIGDRYKWGSLLNKIDIKAYANGGDQLVPAVLDGKNSGDFFEITKSNNGCLDLMFESSKNIKDLTLHTNIKESGINSFYVAVTKDKGKNWLPRGLVQVDNAENNFNLAFQPHSMISGIRIYGVNGTGTGVKIYEVTPYTCWW